MLLVGGVVVKRSDLQASETVVAECLAMVAPAEAAFQSRWRLSTLARIDPDLHLRLREQIDLYGSSLITASTAELRDQATAMVRGWAAACKALEGQLDDAYQIGTDQATNTRVVISESKLSIEAVRAATPDHLRGYRLIWLTPDEIAKIAGGQVAAVKVSFPDAELIGMSKAA